MKENKVLKQSAIIMILVMCGKVLALIKDGAMSAKFGTTSAAGVYSWCFSVIFIFTSISYGISNTVIPMLTEQIESKNLDYRNKFINNLLNVTMVITIIIAIIGIMGAKYIVIFASDFNSNAELFALTVKILRIMFLSVLFLSLQGISAGTLQAHKELSIPSAMSVVSNTVYIIYLFFFVDNFGLIGFAVATVIAFFMQFAINIPKFKSFGYSYKFILNFKDKDLKRLLLLIIPVVISTISIQLNLLVNKGFSTYLNSGYPAILEYSNKLTSLTYEVFAVAVSMMLYPMMATFIAQKNHEEYKKALKKAINIILLVMIPAAVGIIILRVPLISIIYKRGKFSSKDVELVASTLLLYSPAMIAYGVKDIVNRAFYAAKNTKIPMYFSIIEILLNFVLSFVLYRSLGVRGLALAVSMSATIVTFLLILKLNKDNNNIELLEIGRTYIKIVICSILMGVIVYFLKNILEMVLGVSLIANLVTLIISFIIGVISYFVIIYLFKIEESIYILEVVKNKFKK